MTVSDEYRLEAERVITSRLAQLRRLTYQEVAALPQPSAGEEFVFGGTPCKLWMYVQPSASPPLPEDTILVTVQIERERFFGMVSYHTERGLVFSPNAPVRDATEIELRDSGG